MPDPIFERYKEALRAGHVAALRGSPDDALLQYRAAASIAPDRALPHVGMADVLLRLGRHEEALAACAFALRLAPLDDSALDVAARAHLAAGRGADAALYLDRLADLRVRQGRTEEARGAASRAHEADPTDARRDRLAALQSTVDTERARLTNPGWADADATDVTPAHVVPQAPGAMSVPETASAPPEPARSAPPEPGPPEPAAPPPAASLAAETPRTPAGTAAAMPEPEDAAGAPPEPPQAGGAPPEPPPIVHEAPPPEPEAPPPEPADAETLFVRAEERAAGGDARDAARLYVEAAAQYLEAGASDTAVDACLRALAAVPGDTDVHLALARIDLATGHDGRAAEKLDLLDRLLALVGDADGLTRVAAFRKQAHAAAGGTGARRHARRAPDS